MSDSLAFTAPWFRQTFLDQNGNPLSGGSVYFYSAGSTVKKAIWLDLTKTNRAPNPMPLNSSGVPNNQYYFESGLYDIAIYNSNNELIQTLYNIKTSGGNGSISDSYQYYSWFICLDSDAKPSDMTSDVLSNNDKETLLKYGYCIACQSSQSTAGNLSLWYLEAYDADNPTNDVWKEVAVTDGITIINSDRGLRRELKPHFDLPIDVGNQPTFTQLPAGEYTSVLYGDKYWWMPKVTKEYPEPTASVTSALIHDATDDQYKWESVDELGGKVKIDHTDSIADYLGNKVHGDDDAAGNVNIVITPTGNDGTYKTLGMHANVDVIYSEIIDKMNPPSYDLFGTYPDEVGVCQLTGIGAALKAKTLKDSNGNNLAWNRGTGQNGANYGRSCIPGYSYILSSTGTKVKKRIWCAFGITGEIYNSFDRYKSTTRDTSLITADYSNHYIPQGDTSCAAYIKDGSNYYWMYGGFVDNYCYLLQDIPTNYNDDGTFKASGWVWTACPGLLKNVSHVCSVKTGGFLFTGHMLGGLSYKASIASSSTQALANPARLNAPVTKTITSDGYTTEYDLPCLVNQSYNSPAASAVDANGNNITVTQALYIQTTNVMAVYLQTAPAAGTVFTITVQSYMHNAYYTGAGLSGVGSDHYGTYYVIDRDTGRIYSNSSESLTGTFTYNSWTQLELYVRDSDTDNYPATKSDRLGTTFGTQTGDPYTWWSGIQSAYGLWVATIALKQYASDPIYAYSDDGIHWTKYTDGVGIGTSSTLAIWDSQSDGMNWYVTNMYASTPLIFELLVNSIPAHKKLVCEKGLGISGDAFIVDLPSTPILGTDENGKIIASSGSAVVTNLDDLKNVSTSSKTDGQSLYWNNSDSKWETKTITGDHLIITTPEDTVASELVHKVVDSNGAELSVIGNSSYGKAIQIPSASYMGTPNGQQLFDYSLYETTNSILSNGESGTGNSAGTRAFAFIANISRTFRMGYIFVGQTGGTYLRMGIYDANGILLVKSARVPVVGGIIKCPLNLNASNQTVDGVSLIGGVRYYMAYWCDDTTGNLQFGCLSGRNTSTAAPLSQLYDYVNGHEMESYIATADGSNTGFRPWMMISEAAS